MVQLKDLQIDGYERVVEVTDESSGLHAIIAIHNTDNGPALGGTRVYPYASFDEALTDALRLSKGMTYKSSASQTGTGGGKSVIIYDGRKPKPKELLHAFGEAVNALQGKYICAEDVGMPASDLQVVREATGFVVGLPRAGSSGDPSRFTAFGGFLGVKAVAKTLWNADNLKGRTVAVQGLGAVGMRLADQLFWDGAKLIVTDVNEEAVAHAVREYDAVAVKPDEIYGVECDIFVPCALGGIINPKTIPQLKCKGIAGLANNQLLTEADGTTLKERGILYAPDYVINAGGLLNVCEEIAEQGYNPRIARDQIMRLFDFLCEIFAQAKAENQPTNVVANQLAESNLEKGVGKRTKAVKFHH